MVGTTCSRVNLFMNKFRKFGFIDYDSNGITVHSALLSAVVRDGSRPGPRAFASVWLGPNFRQELPLFLTLCQAMV